MPSLALVSQTLRAWTAETRRPLRSYAVCSDTKVGKHDEDLRPSDLSFPATTDPGMLTQAIQRGSSAPTAFTAIFATYQSIAVISEAQKQYGLPTFDLIICDEAHRTVGSNVPGKKSQTHPYFTQVHEDRFVQAKKRLYMTATPRIYAEESKRTAEEHAVVLYSMDDIAVFGPEFHRLNFSQAVEEDILSDYKVIIMTVDEDEALSLFGEEIHDSQDLDAKLTDEAKIIGCWNTFEKRFPKGDDELSDPAPMRKVVAFTNAIKDSVQIRNLFNATQVKEAERINPVICEAQHVDGTMNVATRQAALAWLQDETDPSHCRILTNARCLTEGVDVPALDAVVFMQPRDSQIDVVQAVGRVMRKAPGKKYGYIVLPVVIPAGSDPAASLDDTKTYRVVWQVLNALRAHDDHFNDEINHLEFNQRSRKLRVVGKPGAKNVEQLPLFPAERWEKLFYAKIVNKVGDREYWDEWARKVAGITVTYQAHMRAILHGTDEKSRTAHQAFEGFLRGLHENLNDQVTPDDALEMLAQHMVTQPIFDALFEGYAFSQNNPVSHAMEDVLAVFESHALWKDKASVEKAENKLLETIQIEVQRQAGGIQTAEGKQKLILKIYDKFFRVALKKTADRLGIVYTPVEIVDFILHSVNDVLVQEFDTGLSAESVHILDPFTGTGTFLVRLLQSGLIQPEDLERKYLDELHANELVLLAYYIAVINIEETYHRLSGQAYTPYPGIVLTDTFQQGEMRKDFMGQEYLPENNARLAKENATEIRVIMGNPPYSAGQDSENDNNKNVVYPALDKKIRETYAARSSATLKNSLYDSYIRAIRWASDRIGTQGVIGFVTNGSFIDSNTADGLRRCLAQEFSTLYCWNLRGNARTQGEQRRKESGNVFGSGSRAPVAITILVKNPAKQADTAQIYYQDIGDYLTREDKLQRIRRAESIRQVEWTLLEPNAAGDWIHQRSEAFGQLIPLGDKKMVGAKTVFGIYSNGVKTNRDAWVYNFSRNNLAQNMLATIAVYNDHVDRFSTSQKGAMAMKDVEAFIDTDPHKISWSVNLKSDVIKGRNHLFQKPHIVPSMYRPFTKQWLYFDRAFNERVLQIPKLFPDSAVENRVIEVTGIGASKEFSTLITDAIPNLHMHDTGQCFPLYYYTDANEPKELSQQITAFEEETAGPRWVRHEAITDWAYEEFRQRVGPNVTKEDIFYYVYGVLHAPDYRTQFADDLKKMLPRVPFAGSPALFWSFSSAGRDLAHWHLDYETVDPWPLDEQRQGTVTDAVQLYHVDKMRWGKAADGKVDKSTILYNPYLTLSGIPLEAYEYIVNGKSALDWVMERYQVKTDKDSGIVNDPNAWSEDPRYIVDLVKRVVRVSMEMLRIVEELPPLEFRK